VLLYVLLLLELLPASNNTQYFLSSELSVTVGSIQSRLLKKGGVISVIKDYVAESK